ncbi:DUF975 family protein [Dellaglioa sp. BT-FLS60]
MDKPLKTRRELKNSVKVLFKEHWKTAILTSLIVSALTIIANSFYLHAYLGSIKAGSKTAIYTTSFSIYLILTFAASFILIGVNYSFLNWFDSKELSKTPVRDSFQIFSNEFFLSTIWTAIVKYFFTTLWALLLWVPGIIKKYSYSQVYLINKDLAENPNHPELTARQKLKLSAKLMKGHKFDLFVLELSFLGWNLLSTITFGISTIWVLPYQSTTYVAFYRDLAGDTFLTMTTNK